MTESGATVGVVMLRRGRRSSGETNTANALVSKSMVYGSSCASKIDALCLVAEVRVERGMHSHYCVGLEVVMQPLFIRESVKAWTQMNSSSPGRNKIRVHRH
jgi:hypothetical protein